MTARWYGYWTLTVILLLTLSALFGTGKGMITVVNVNRQALDKEGKEAR